MLCFVMHLRADLRQGIDEKRVRVVESTNRHMYTAVSFCESAVGFGGGSPTDARCDCLN